MRNDWLLLPCLSFVGESLVPQRMWTQIVSSVQWLYGGSCRKWVSGALVPIWIPTESFQVESVSGLLFSFCFSDYKLSPSFLPWLSLSWGQKFRGGDPSPLHWCSWLRWGGIWVRVMNFGVKVRPLEATEGTIFSGRKSGAENMEEEIAANKSCKPLRIGDLDRQTEVSWQTWTMGTI